MKRSLFGWSRHRKIWFGINFFVSIIPLGVIISWICIRNRKSIPAAILFHFVINMSQEMLDMTQVTKCIQTLVLTAVAAALVFGDRELFRGVGNGVQQTRKEAEKGQQKSPLLKRTGV